MANIDVFEAALDAAGKIYRRRGDQITSQCPAHEDRSPSFGVKELPDGRILFNCHAGCDKERILHSLGLDWHHVFPDTDKHYSPLYRKKQSLDQDEMVIAIAEMDMAKGKKLNARDKARYAEALLKTTETAA